jgi:hypothetical protein
MKCFGAREAQNARFLCSFERMCRHRSDDTQWRRCFGLLEGLVHEDYALRFQHNPVNHIRADSVHLYLDQLRYME